MAQRVVEFRFQKEIRDPCNDANDQTRFPRLVQAPGRTWTYVQEGPWLKITGTKRTVWTTVSNVIDALVEEYDDKAAQKVGGK